MRYSSSNYSNSKWLWYSLPTYDYTWAKEEQDRTETVMLDYETIEYNYESGLLTSIRVKGDCGSYVDFDVVHSDTDGLTVVPNTIGPKVDVVAIREWTRQALSNIPKRKNSFLNVTNA